MYVCIAQYTCRRPRNGALEVVTFRYVCMYVCYVCIARCIGMYVYACMYVCVCIHACMYVSCVWCGAHAVCMCMHACMYVWRGAHAEDQEIEP